MKKYHVSGEFLVDTSLDLALIPYFDSRVFFFFGGAGGGGIPFIPWELDAVVP